PSLAIDNNVAHFVDTAPDGSTVTQDDPFAGNVYVAYVTNDIPPSGNPAGNNFNPTRVHIVASSDGGLSFTGDQIVNDNGNFGPERNFRPRLIVSQAAPERQVTGGQVTIVWEDTGTGANDS